MVRHRILRAVPRVDLTVSIEWDDRTTSVVDMRAHIRRGGLLADLEQPAIFMKRLFVQSEGESLGWEVFGHMLDFDADDLWRESHAQASAAE